MDYGFGDCHSSMVTKATTIFEDVGNPFQLDRTDCLEIFIPSDSFTRL
jgi:hypothetical protein